MHHIHDLIRQLFEMAETALKEEDTLTGVLEAQRRAIPREYGNLHEVNGGSHRGVGMVMRGESIHDLMANLFRITDDMARSDVPQNLSTQPRFDAEQEVVELALFEVLWRLATGVIPLSEVNLDSLTYSTMGVSPQAYLHGWVDAATEWAKGIRDYLNDKKFSLDEKQDFLRNTIEGLLLIRDRLFPYTNEPAVDAYTRRGWMNKFRGKLGRLADLIDRLKDRMADILDKIDLMQELRTKS